MITYVRLALAIVFVIALGVENFWVYRKGQDSIISNVVAGVATTVKQQDQAATEAVQAATAATEIQDTIKHETVIRHEKLQANAAAHPQPDCQLDPDSLSVLQAIARATK